MNRARHVVAIGAVGLVALVVIVASGGGAGADAVTETFLSANADHYEVGGHDCNAPTETSTNGGVTGFYVFDNCSSVDGSSSIYFYATAASTSLATYAGGSDSGDCEFYLAEAPVGTTPAGTFIGNKNTWANGAYQARTHTLSTTAGVRYRLRWTMFLTANARCGPTSLGVIGHEPTTTTTTAPTTTTTAPPATSNVEDFDVAPFLVSAVEGETAPMWSGLLLNIFSTSAAMDGAGWNEGMTFSFVPYGATVSFKLQATGFREDGGCEVHGGPSGSIEWTGQKVVSGLRTITLDASDGIVAGTRYFVMIGHDGASRFTDAATNCTVDDVGPVADREGGVLIDGTPLDEGDSEADPDPGPSSTGDDGLDDCIPSGWSLVNPFAYVGAIGCSLEWAFVPSTDMGDVADEFADAGADKVPFSWVASFGALGGTAVNGLDDPGECWVSLETEEGTEAATGVDLPAEVDQLWGTGNCGFDHDDGGLGEVHDKQPMVKAIFGLIMWVALAVRMVNSGPWNKGKDSGGPDA